MLYQNEFIFIVKSKFCDMMINHEMKKIMQVDDLVKTTGGRLICRRSSNFERVCIDTRLKKQIKSSAFFALKGQKDGHDFASQAYQKGALVLVVENIELPKELKNKITVVQVPDVLSALGKWAFFWRKKLHFQVAGITGSNGKTTAKHFCKILFEDDSFVQVSPKSYNNNVGVPLSLLDVDHQTKILIQEIGTNQAGEIQHLCSIADPNVVACTLVSPTHLKGFGSVEKVAQEKEQIYLSCPQATAVFNLDNSWTKKMKNRFHGKTLTVSSQNHKADIFLKVQNKGKNFLRIEGRIGNERQSCSVPLAGEHHLTSLMTSAGVALALGKNSKDIWKKLPCLRNPEGRCQWMTLNNKLEIFFDAYNSNPQSAQVFLDYLSQFKKPYVLCLGDMLELGDQASFFHEELGKKVATYSFHALFFIGQYRFDFEKGLKKGKFKGNYELFEKHSLQCSQKILSNLGSASFLALKASRGLKFERIIENLNSLVQ